MSRNPLTRAITMSIGGLGKELWIQETKQERQY